MYISLSCSELSYCMSIRCESTSPKELRTLAKVASLPQVAMTPLRNILALDPQFPWNTFVDFANQPHTLTPTVRWNMVREPSAPFAVIVDGERLKTGFEGYTLGMPPDEAYDFLWGLAQGAVNAIADANPNSYRTDQFARVMNIITNPHCSYREIWTVLPFAEEIFLAMLDTARGYMTSEAHAFRQSNTLLAQQAQPIGYEKSTLRQTMFLPTRSVSCTTYTPTDLTEHDRTLFKFLNGIGGIGHATTRTLIEKGILGDYRRKIKD